VPGQALARRRACRRTGAGRACRRTHGGLGAGPGGGRDVAEPIELLTEIAYRRGVGALFADGEEAALRRLGPEAARYLPALPGRRRRGIGVADLLGTCRRMWRERPGDVLRSALVATRGLLADAG